MTNFPVNAATWCIFVLACMWASFQMSSSVETYIRGCQSHTFSNTQVTLNILIGRLLEHEEDGEAVIMRDGGQFSDEGLPDDEWKNHLLLVEPIGSMRTAKV